MACVTYIMEKTSKNTYMCECEGTDVLLNIKEKHIPKRLLEEFKKENLPKRNKNKSKKKKK